MNLKQCEKRSLHKINEISFGCSLAEMSSCKIYMEEEKKSVKQWRQSGKKNHFKKLPWRRKTWQKTKLIDFIEYMQFYMIVDWLIFTFNLYGFIQFFTEFRIVTGMVHVCMHQFNFSLKQKNVHNSFHIGIID